MTPIEIASNEKKLQSLLENLGVGDDAAKKKAQLTMMVYADMEGITYEECMMLHNEAVNFLKHTPPGDPAFDFLIKQRDNSLKYAGALNDINNMGRKEHLVSINALVTVGETCTEVTMHVPKLHLRTDNREAHIKLFINNKVRSSSEWSPGLRYGTVVDFIEL